MYEIIEPQEPFITKMLVRTNEDGTKSWIPLDPANSDYQRYLRWLENPDADETQGGIN
jgi:hypothetical protein